MLRIITLFMVAILATCVTAAQSCICNKSYETDLRSLTVVPDSFQQKEDWLSSIEFNKKQLSDSITDYANYRLAASYSMSNNSDSAYKYLNRFIDLSKDDRCIMVDKKFNNLKKDSLYRASITERIEHNYLLCLDSRVNKEFALKLFYLGIKDQQYRKYYPIMQQSFDPSEWTVNDLQNDSIFTFLVKNFGFPHFQRSGGLHLIPVF